MDLNVTWGELQRSIQARRHESGVTKKFSVCIISGDDGACQMIEGGRVTGAAGCWAAHAAGPAWRDQTIDTYKKCRVNAATRARMQRPIP
jgi:hypothetical protein